ncbi:MAG: cyclic nucleotide-binding domain-containing protein [Gammaproteobacteria bacterium]|nr:cyclic nucleotide-binding domain-containing protein [Gammaproteobacteria bacterium]
MIYWEGGVPWSHFLGLAGVAVYIGAYFALQAGLVKGQGYLYASLNTAAACLVLISLTENFNLPSAVIQVTYIAISVFGMARFYMMTHHIRFTEEELGVLSMALPGIPKLECRRFLDKGEWKDAPEGTVLTEEGEPVRSLSFLVSGGARVEVGGKTVAQLDPPALVGEMSVVMKQPASATVTVTEPSRLLCIDVGVLDGFLERNATVRHALESRIASHLGGKLGRSNAALSAKN